MSPGFIWVTVLLALLPIGQPANILFYFELSTYSHRITVWPLVQALAARGHNVTFAQNFSPKSSTPGVTEFFPAAYKAKLAAELENFGVMNPIQIRAEKGRFGTQMMAVALPELGLQRCQDFLSDPETKEWARTATFDLIVIDGLWNECALGLAARFGAKTILYGTTHPFPWLFESFGVVPESSWIPEIHFSHQHPLTFLQRTTSTLIHLAIHYYRIFLYFPKMETILRKELDFPEMPALAELERDVSLAFYNSHFSEELARSLPPFYVPVGGMHVDMEAKNPSSVSKEIRDFISGSGDDGFILVSFGGEAKISAIPRELQQIFFKAFELSKTRILLKWEGDRPKEMPPNVFTVNWYPQKEVLAAKNIRAFITHGGLLSMQEAVTHGVPMIAFPLFAEQDYNAWRLERTGRGIRLEISTLTLEELSGAISNILTDKSYKLNVEKASRLFQDRPAKPVETAVWWTEYVLRNADTNHLKPLSSQQYWFQRRLLDVWAFILLALITPIALFLYILKRLISAIFGGPAKAHPDTLRSAKGGSGKRKVKKS